MRLRLFVERSYPAINSLACVANPQILIAASGIRKSGQIHCPPVGDFVAAIAKELSRGIAI